MLARIVTTDQSGSSTRDRKLLGHLRGNNKYRKEEEEEEHTESVTSRRLARFDTPLLPCYLTRQLYLEPALMDRWCPRQGDLKL